MRKLFKGGNYIYEELRYITREINSTSVHTTQHQKLCHATCLVVRDYVGRLLGRQHQIHVEPLMIVFYYITFQPYNSYICNICDGRGFGWYYEGLVLLKLADTVLILINIGQSFIYQVLQTIQMKLILLCVWAEPAVLGSAKTALKFIYEI